MIYKALYTLPNISSGIDDGLRGTVTAVPSFTPMFLLFVFGIILLGGLISQQRRIGTADFPVWFFVASFSTTIIALPLTLVFGLIDLTTLSIVVAMTLISVIILGLHYNRNEL